MKVCAYCDSTVDDDVSSCPHCSSVQFKNKCRTCGGTYEGAECPSCRERMQHDHDVSEANRREREARAKATQGLAWKTVLAVILPPIGGYFLINDYVGKGFRYFAIAWCALMAFEMAFLGGYSIGLRAVCSLACLAPIGVYLLRTRAKRAEQSGAKAKTPLAVFGVLVALVLAFDVVGGVMHPESAAEADSPAASSSSAASAEPSSAAVASSTSEEPAAAASSSADTSSSAAAASSSTVSQSEGTAKGGVVVVPPVPATTGSAASSTASVSTSASSTAELSTSASARAVADVKLGVSTKYLEYSGKTVDPATLVTCDNADAAVTASGDIDLSQVGTQKVSYTITLDGQEDERDVKYVVRDTKAPKIKLVDAKPAIDVGEDFDALANVKSVADKVDGELGYVDAAPEAAGDKKGLERFYDAGWYTIDGTVDSSVPGTYSLMVLASDKHGNTASREMLVKVRGSESAVGQSAAEQHTYILNTNPKSHKFHLPGCRDVGRMSDANKSEVTATRDEVESWGYTACQHCNP